GTYKLTTRAVGYDLVDPGGVAVAAGKTTMADVKLQKTKNLANQLSSMEWIMSMSGMPDEKYRMIHTSLSCNYCHTLQRIAKSNHTAEEFMPIIHRMIKYYADGSAISNDNKRGVGARIQEPRRVPMLENSPNWGGMPRTEVAAFFAK